MALSPIQLKPKQSGGKGGLLGKIIGTVVGGVAGGVAGAATGNPELAISGANLGGSLGGVAGGLADPAKQEGGRGVGTLSRASTMKPDILIAKIADGQRELAQMSGISATEKQSLIDQMEEAKKRQQEMLTRAV